MRLGIPRKCGRDLVCEAGDAPGPSQEVSCSATIKSKANSAAVAAASATVSITGRPQLVQIALEAGAARAEFKRNPSSRDRRGDTWQTHSSCRASLFWAKARLAWSRVICIYCVACANIRGLLLAWVWFASNIHPPPPWRTDAVILMADGNLRGESVRQARVGFLLGTCVRPVA